MTSLLTSQKIFLGSQNRKQEFFFTFQLQLNNNIIKLIFYVVSNVCSWKLRFGKMKNVFLLNLIFPFRPFNFLSPLTLREHIPFFVSLYSNLESDPSRKEGRKKLET